jgi:hypothetical protein
VIRFQDGKTARIQTTLQVRELEGPRAATAAAAAAAASG